MFAVHLFPQNVDKFSDTSKMTQTYRRGKCTRKGHAFVLVNGLYLLCQRKSRVFWILRPTTSFTSKFKNDSTCNPNWSHHSLNLTPNTFAMLHTCGSLTSWPKINIGYSEINEKRIKSDFIYSVLLIGTNKQDPLNNLFSKIGNILGFSLKRHESSGAPVLVAATRCQYL